MTPMSGLPFSFHRKRTPVMHCMLLSESSILLMCHLSLRSELKCEEWEPWEPWLEWLEWWEWLAVATTLTPSSDEEMLMAAASASFASRPAAAMALTAAPTDIRDCLEIVPRSSFMKEDAFFFNEGMRSFFAMVMLAICLLFASAQGCSCRTPFRAPPRWRPGRHPALERGPHAAPRGGCRR